MANSDHLKLWKCHYCGTQDIQGSKCPNCDADRPDNPSSIRPGDRDINRPRPTDTSHQTTIFGYFKGEPIYDPNEWSELIITPEFISYPLPPKPNPNISPKSFK